MIDWVSTTVLEASDSNGKTVEARAKTITYFVHVMDVCIHATMEFYLFSHLL
jgi:hypothetical protein